MRGRRKVTICNQGKQCRCAASKINRGNNPKMLMTSQRTISTGALMAAAFITATIAGCDSLPNKADQTLSNCKNIRPDIIKLSEKDRASSGYALVAIYEPTEISKSATELNCRGKASWSDNEETAITYKQYIDQEGSVMLQYDIPQ